LKAQLQVKRKKDLSIVVEEKEEAPIKRSTSEVHLQREPITIKDLKEPLQLLSLNTLTPKASGKPTQLSKTNEKKGRAVPRKRVS
jgi:hypothetical protein